MVSLDHTWSWDAGDRPDERDADAMVAEVAATAAGWAASGHPAEMQYLFWGLVGAEGTGVVRVSADDWAASLRLLLGRFQEHDVVTVRLAFDEDGLTALLIPWGVEVEEWLLSCRQNQERG